VTEKTISYVQATGSVYAADVSANLVGLVIVVIVVLEKIHVPIMVLNVLAM